MDWLGYPETRANLDLVVILEIVTSGDQVAWETSIRSLKEPDLETAVNISRAFLLVASWLSPDFPQTHFL